MEGLQSGDRSNGSMNNRDNNTAGDLPPQIISSNGGGGEVAAAGASTATMTLTQQQQQQTNTQTINNEVLRLTLRPRSNVTWDSEVVDNEGLGRKSSKRCCIWHKQRAFGESSTESSDDDHDDDDDSTSSSSSGGGGSGNARPIARRKKTGGVDNKPKKVPDYQRFHA